MEMPEAIKMIYQGGSAEVIEKKSRFIGEIYPIGSEEEAQNIVNQIRKKQEQLKLLQQQEEKKKVQVIAAKIDTSRYEKLKDRRQSEYEKAAKKAQELFIEEFASRTARYSQNREVI